MTYPAEAAQMFRIISEPFAVRVKPEVAGTHVAAIAVPAAIAAILLVLATAFVAFRLTRKSEFD